MIVDYTKFAVGVALGAGVRMTACPVCGKSCHATEQRRGWRYVHEVELDTDRDAVTPRSFHEHTHDERNAWEFPALVHLDGPIGKAR